VADVCTLKDLRIRVDLIPCIHQDFIRLKVACRGQIKRAPDDDDQHHGRPGTATFIALEECRSQKLQ
jgi:hypothetical protein